MREVGKSASNGDLGDGFSGEEGIAQIAPAWAIVKGFVSGYFDNSLAYDSPQAEKLRQAAKRNNIVVALGLSERDGGSLYIAQWIIGSDGETVAKRRKLKPTHVERSVFGEGDGSDRTVY